MKSQSLLDEGSDFFLEVFCYNNTLLYILIPYILYNIALIFKKYGPYLVKRSDQNVRANLVTINN